MSDPRTCTSRSRRAASGSEHLMISPPPAFDPLILPLTGLTARFRETRCRKLTSFTRGAELHAQSSHTGHVIYGMYGGLCPVHLKLKETSSFYSREHKHNFLSHCRVQTRPDQTRPDQTRPDHRLLSVTQELNPASPPPPHPKIGTKRP
ncbi:unnamed protein product [Pleuronectes platessa]|uniref:Uncharacterized protein n=1 Tax=Pleuronectes platessa TaxID=8262 RepID=A0A9N7UL32_PLEPL|nr:unnamed protein product [Pleuronectes platessa]